MKLAIKMLMVMEFREAKDGKEFKITFRPCKRTEANEALVQQYIAWWKKLV